MTCAVSPQDLVAARRQQISLLSSMASGGTAGAAGAPGLFPLRSAGGSGQQHHAAHQHPQPLSSSAHTTGTSSQATPRSLGQGGGSGLVSGLDQALQQQATLGHGAGGSAPPPPPPPPGFSPAPPPPGGF